MIFCSYLFPKLFAKKKRKRIPTYLRDEPSKLFLASTSRVAFVIYIPWSEWLPIIPAVFGCTCYLFVSHEQQNFFSNKISYQPMSPKLNFWIFSLSVLFWGSSNSLSRRRMCRTHKKANRDCNVYLDSDITDSSSSLFLAFKRDVQNRFPDVVDIVGFGLYKGLLDLFPLLCFPK